MTWPWRRRKSALARHALPRQVATWAAPAFPPAAPAPAPAPARHIGVPTQASGVLLGFVDGTQVALDERDPHAVALRAVANILSQPGRTR